MKSCRTRARRPCAPPMVARAFAPAKINLALHVTGRRTDGYHLMDSLVVFADVGDTVSAAPADDWSLTIEGPFAAGLSLSDNLCLDAARLTDAPPARLTLTKRLPVASGIGGGSADAAATLRALHEMDARPIPEDTLTLGADVPVCLAGRPARMRGIGELLSPVPPLPPAHLCLVNPRVPVSSPQVFGSLLSRQNAPLPDPVPWSDLDAFVGWLTDTRNDLEPAARKIAPEIDTVLAALANSSGCHLARMSGSGATCFGLYATATEAKAAADALRAAGPDWWIASAVIRD